MQNNLRKFVTIGAKVSVCVRVCERVRVCLCVMHQLIRTFARTRQFFCVDKYYYATENDPNLNSRQQLFSLLLSPPPPHQINNRMQFRWVVCCVVNLGVITQSTLILALFSYRCCSLWSTDSSTIP